MLFAAVDVDRDSAPNAGFCIFSATVHERKPYLQFSLAENRTKADPEAGSAVVVMYAPLPTQGSYPTVGAPPGKPASCRERTALNVRSQMLSPGPIRVCISFGCRSVSKNGWVRPF